MKIKSGKRRDFWGYITPLRHLEQAFQMVGIKADFILSLDSNTELRSLEIERTRGVHHILLESSPKEAVQTAAYLLACGKEKKNG
jgi:hypothetical protein